MSLCSVLDCYDIARALGFCLPHYRRYKSGGSLDIPIQPRQKAKGIKCRVPECDRLCWAKGLCRLHDNRSRLGFTEDQLALPPNFLSVLKKGWISHGYRWISTGGKEVMEHRHVMEAFLGRQLSIDELVHHINEDKLDNRIENLEVRLRGPHTSHHRKHQQPCKICGELKLRKDRKGYEGALGYCAYHYQRFRDDKL